MTKPSGVEVETITSAAESLLMVCLECEHDGETCVNGCPVDACIARLEIIRKCHNTK